MSRKEVENALVRCRRLFRRAGTKTPTNKYEVFSLDASIYCLADTAQQAREKARAIFSQTQKPISVWSPLRGHIYQVKP